MGGGGADPPERRPGSCYLVLISPAGSPALTGLRLGTGTNEQLHPACPPGIMGLPTVRGSVCASFLHFLFARFARCRTVVSPPPIIFFLMPCLDQIVSLIHVNPTSSSVCLVKTIQHAVESWLSWNPSVALRYVFQFRLPQYLDALFNLESEAFPDRSTESRNVSHDHTQDIIRQKLLVCCCNVYKWVLWHL